MDPMLPARTWPQLGRLAAASPAGLTAPPPAAPGWCTAPGLCATCFGPAAAGRACCFQCDLHRQCAPGSLASAVLPAAYAVKGGPHARNLWVYKSGGPGAAEAGRALTVLLLVFLREHGPCLWRRAGGAAGQSGPTHLAVVPSGRGRRGPHPLRALAEPYLRRPWADLAARPGADGSGRDLDPQRFTCPPLAGARVLLLDDTWTTGASVQSAAIALRGAGATAVGAVVLGRDLARPAGPAVAFAAGQCAMHPPGTSPPRQARAVA